MKERGILFSAPMVRALLAGTKTQTRRAMKPQPHHVDGGVPFGDPPAWAMRDGAAASSAVMRCPYGKPGDGLWVRETFAGALAYEKHGYPLKDWGNKLWFIADGEPRSGHWTRPRPSIHMPRVLSRITLEVTEVRVERLQDISEADAMAEGIGPFMLGFGLPDGRYYSDDPRQSYFQLFEHVNGAGSWDANPWVWVVSFRRPDTA